MIFTEGTCTSQRYQKVLGRVLAVLDGPWALLSDNVKRSLQNPGRVLVASTLRQWRGFHKLTRMRPAGSATAMAARRSAASAPSSRTRLTGARPVPAKTCSGRELEETASPRGGVESIGRKHADRNEYHSEPDSASREAEPASD